MPQPFAPRVKNALDAEPRSVRLSNLVGAGGLWYGFGRMVVRLWVTRGFASLPLLRLWSRLDEERGVEMSNLFMTVRENRRFGGYFFPHHLQTFRDRLTEIIDQAQHFAVSGQGVSGSVHDDAAAAFREGLDGTERERESPVTSADV
jgi:GINS complex subunit 3